MSRLSGVQRRILAAIGLAIMLIFSPAMSCEQPIKVIFRNNLATCTPENIIIQNDTIKATLNFSSAAIPNKPNRLAILSVYLEGDRTEKIIIGDTVELENLSQYDRIERQFMINLPTNASLMENHGVMTYQITLMNSKNGAYKQTIRKPLADIFADSAIYKMMKLHKPPTE